MRDGLQVIVDTLKTSETGGTTFLDIRGGLASFGYDVTAQGVESVDQIVDASIAIAHNIMRRLCGPAWRPSRVQLIRDPPRDKGPFSKFFEAPIDYAEPSGCLVFDAATLDAPVRDRNPEYAEILAPLLEEAAANAPGDFLSAVKLIIRSQVGLGALSRDSVCRALGLNARTLAHRLEGFGVSYSGLADEARIRGGAKPAQKGKADRRDRIDARLRRAERLHPRLQGVVRNHACALADVAQGRLRGPKTGVRMEIAETGFFATAVVELDASSLRTY